MRRKKYNRFFVNPFVQENYVLRPGQTDCNIIVQALNWRSRLSQITDRVAEQMLKQGNKMIVRK